MTDPAAIASEFAANRTDYLLLGQKVDSGFQAVDRAVAAITTAQAAQGDRIERLLSMIHEIQLKSTGLERLGGDIQGLKDEFTRAVSGLEAKQSITSESVNQFKGAIKVWSITSGLIVALVSALAYYAVDRRFEQIDKQIETLRTDVDDADRAVDNVRNDVTELRATRGAR